MSNWGRNDGIYNKINKLLKVAENHSEGLDVSPQVKKYKINTML